LSDRRIVTPGNAAPRVLLCSFYFPPAAAVGARRPGRLARLLPKHGFEVDVVSAPFDLDRKRGVLAGDSSQVGLDVHPGATMHVPVPFTLGRDPYDIPGSGLTRVWWKARAYFEAIFLTKDWADRWGAATAARLEADGRLEEYDLVLLDAPPEGAVAPIARLARRVGVPVVVDFRDLLLPPSEESTRGIGHSRRRNRWIRSALLDLFEIGSHFFFTSPAASAAAIDALQLDPERVTTVTNGFLARSSIEASDEESRLTSTDEPGPIRVVHAGHLVYGRATLLRTVLEGFERYTSDTGREIELVLVGAERDDVRREVGATDFAGMITVLDWVPREEAFRIQCEADALLLLQPDDGEVRHRVIIPGKLFEYMAARRPLLSLATPVTDAIVSEHGLGVVIGERSVPGVRAALARMDDESRWGRRLPAPPERFSEASTVALVAEVLHDVVRRSR
jgi:glycosyltransferase involved in cell wall biosynthesis